MQQEASDEAIVVMMSAERRMERRASVIQSSILEQPLKLMGGL